MAYDYITRGVPVAPIPAAPALAVDIVNDALYIGNPITGTWALVGGSPGPSTAVNLPTSASPNIGTINQNGSPILNTFTAGQPNLFLGPNAGNFTNTSAGRNIGIGSSTLTALTTGNTNTVIGANAGLSIDAGSSNTLFGKSSGVSITSGSNNTTIGNGAGGSISTGQRNLVIGSNADVVNGTANDQLSIGNTIHGTGLNGPDTGSIGINVPTPTNTLDILGGITFSGSLNPLNAIVANGAIPETLSANYVVTVATALTIAAPASDNLRIEVTTFDTATPVLTFTGNTLNSGSASVASVHFAAFAGSSITLVSHTGKWIVISQNAVTFA